MVVWQGIAPDDIGLATVIRLPAAAALDHNHAWCQDGCLVVNAEHALPEYAGAQRHILHRHAHQAPGVLLRAADPEWTEADATSWISAQIETRGPFASVAVLWTDTCVMHSQGLRLRVTKNGLGLITMVPAALLASITHSPRRKPPGRLRVHPFGSAGHECTFQVETTGTFQLPWQPPQQTHPVPNWSAATATGAA